MTDSTLQKSFLITCSQGFLFMFLVSMWFVYTPVLFDYINITKTQYGFTGVIFGVANIFCPLATRRCRFSCGAFSRLSPPAPHLSGPWP